MSETLTAEVANAAVPTTAETQTVANTPAIDTKESKPQASASDAMKEIMATLVPPAETFPGEPGVDEDTPDELVAGEAEAEKGAESKADDAKLDEKPAEEGTPVVASDRKLLAEFTVKDKDGELEIPDLTLSFKANGEIRELSLDKVVKLAQVGFYNEERQREVETLRSELPQLQTQLQEKNAEAQYFRDTWHKALDSAARGDFSVLQNELDAYTEAMRPEAQLKRTQQELAAVRNSQVTQQQVVQDTQQAQQFATALSGAFDELASKYPEVSHEEIIGKFSTLTAPLMQGGRLPPAQFQRAAQLVQTELVPFVESRNATRSSASVNATKEADAKVAAQTAKAKQAQAAAKRTLARVTKPTTSASSAATGGIGSTSAAPKSPPVYKSANDALAGIMAEVPSMAATR